MKAFIIRLEENSHSCDMAQDCFEQAVKFNLEPIFFKAINGNDADLHYEQTGLFKKRKFKKGRIGVLGCFFSHYYLWNKCIELDEAIIILEHDGYIIKSITDDILDTFEDVLKLDRHDPYSKTYNEVILKEQDYDLDVIKYINPTPKDPKKLGTGNYFKGAYSYILKPQGAKKLVNWVKENGHLPADQQIGDWVVDTKVTVPTLARLHPFYAEGNNISTASLTANPELL